MNDELEHRGLTEALGAYALRHLSEPETLAIESHLDGCSACRQELADLQGLAEALKTVDVGRLADEAAPPPGLGEALRSRVRDEQSERTAGAALEQRHTRRSRWGAVAAQLVAAVAIIALAVGAGAVVGRHSISQPVPPPTEQVVMTSEPQTPVTFSESYLINHTWGTELRIKAVGFESGEVFTASFRTVDGTMVPAGEFLGVGDEPMVCNLQSAALRDRVTAVVVTDGEGQEVARATL